MSSVVEDRPFQCGICDNTYKRKDHLKRHLYMHREMGLHELWGGFDGEENLQLECEDCGKVFTRKDHLKRHERIHQRDRMFECPICGCRFLRNEHLQRHYLVHPAPPPQERTCMECKLLFSSLEALTIHQEKGHIIPPTPPPLILDQSLSSDYSLCRICGQVFTTAHELQTHETIHQSRYPYVCTICGSRFDSPRGLLSHDHSNLSITHLELRIDQLSQQSADLSQQLYELQISQNSS